MPAPCDAKSSACVPLEVSGGASLRFATNLRSARVRAEMDGTSRMAMNHVRVAALLLCSCTRSSRDGCAHGSGALVPLLPGPRTIKTVFVIVMENKTWAEIQGRASAPYLNSTLLPAASFATQYSDSGLHRSEPNYLWLEGGTDYGIRVDDDHASTRLHNRAHMSSYTT